MKAYFKFIVLLCYFAASEAAKHRCDYRHTSIGYFRYHEMPMSWFDARLHCHSEGAVLASPSTPQMKAFMLAAFCKPQIFTGIHATLTKGQYYTIEGIPIDRIPHEWAPFEPDNKNNEEDCLVMNSDGQLSDVRCNEPRPFICFKEHSKAEVNVCGTTDPEYHYESRTNKCYKFHTSPRQFKRANFVCQAEGGHLVIINSEEEAKVIREIFARYPPATMIGNFWKDVAFVGFYNWGESADWRTIHGQTLKEAGYDKFSPGEPNNATEGEYCGAVYRTALFDDLWCEKHYAFICEKEPSYPPICDPDKPEQILPYTGNCKNDILPENNIDLRSPAAN